MRVNNERTMKELIKQKANELARMSSGHIDGFWRDKFIEMAEWTMELYENQGCIVVHTENLTDEQRMQIALHIKEYLTNTMKGE